MQTAHVCFLFVLFWLWCSEDRWTLSKNIRFCGCQVFLVHSNDSFPHDLEFSVFRYYLTLHSSKAISIEPACPFISHWCFCLSTLEKAVLTKARQSLSQQLADRGFGETFSFQDTSIVNQVDRYQNDIISFLQTKIVPHSLASRPGIPIVRNFDIQSSLWKAILVVVCEAI